MTSDLTTIECLLVRNGHLVIPEHLRDEVLRPLHNRHQIVMRCWAINGDSARWPGVTTLMGRSKFVRHPSGYYESPRRRCLKRRCQNDHGRSSESMCWCTMEKKKKTISNPWIIAAHNLSGNNWTRRQELSLERKVECSQCSKFARSAKVAQFGSLQSKPFVSA